jgi:amidase
MVIDTLDVRQEVAEIGPMLRRLAGLRSRLSRAPPFQIVEASIDDIHTAFRSGRLTARQLVQGYLDRINAYDRQGPNINSVITINPDALAEADRLDAAFRTSGLAGPAGSVI